MLNTSAQWFAVMTDVSLKAIMLVGVVAAVLKVFRIADYNLRHRVWTGTLIGLFLLPALVSFVPTIGIPILPVSHENSAVENSAPVAAESRVNLFGPFVDTEADIETGSSPAVTSSSAEHPVFPNAVLANAQRSEVVLPSDDAQQSNLPGQLPALSSQGTVPWSLIVLTIWCGGAMVLLARLALGVAYSLRLRQSSTAIARHELAELGVHIEHEGRFNGADASAAASLIAECPLIHVPLTIGAIRPVILLPPDWLTWQPEKLRDVITHESTHVRRRDYAVMLLAELNRCLYWFHPLAWWLRAQLAILAEQTCDDAAIEAAQGDRPRYARHLLEVAQAAAVLNGRLAQSGIAMAQRPNVESRILSILDFARPLTQRMTWFRGLILLGLMVPLIALTAALRPAAAQSVDIPEPSVTTEPDKASIKEVSPNPAKTESIASNSAEADKKIIVARSYSGHVTDEVGNGVPQAKLFVSMARYTAADPRHDVSLHEVGQTDGRGDFQFDIDDSLWNSLKTDTFSGPSVIALKEGLGISGLPLAMFAFNAPISDRVSGLKQDIDKAFENGFFNRRTIIVPPLSNEIHGRLLDLQGDPLPGVSVSIQKIEMPDVKQLLTAFEESSSEGAGRARHRRWIAQTTNAAAMLLQKLQPAIVTDANGEFRIRGLGKDQLAEVTFFGERVESQRIHVLGRDMDTQRVPHFSFYPLGAKDVYHGTQFTHVLGPSVPVTGVVTEFQSGKPIADALVYVERLFREENMRTGDSQLRLDVQHILAVTDVNGHYTLQGIPTGGEHVLRTVPPKTDPWLMSQNVLTTSPDQDKCELNVQVFRGIWIEGQFTDGTTMEPLTGFVDYLALQKNPNIPRSFGLQDDWEKDRFPVDDHGHFRVPGLPGPGVLFAWSNGPQRYPLSVGADSVAGYEGDRSFLPTTPTGMPLTNWNRIQQIDPPADAKSFSYDLTLTAGASVAGHVQGPNGEAISGLEIMGLVGKSPFWAPQNDNTFSVLNYDSTKPRQLFFRSNDKAFVGEFKLNGEPSQGLTINLQPSVTVRGRLIDNESDEPAAGYKVYCEKSSVGSFRIGENSGAGGEVDDNGHFEIRGLLAGIVYQMDAMNIQHFISQKNGFTIDLSKVQPGSTVELGDVTGKNAKKPEINAPGTNTE